MKLVSDWRNALRWHSTQAFVVLAALPSAWLILPDDLKDKVPAEWLPYIIPVVAIGGLIGRVRDQG